MSERTKSQFEETYARLAAAVHEASEAKDLVAKRVALRDVVSLCDAFKASANGYLTALGHQKWESEQAPRKAV